MIKRHSLFLLMFLGFGLQSIFAQVTAASYELVYNEKEKQFDVYLVVLEGSAQTTRHRVQFNSQISLVVPTGTTLEIVKNHNPFQDNQQYKGTVPLIWELVKPLIAPSPSPKSDFYAVRPVLFPSSFYNDVSQGDKIKLFTFKAVTDMPEEVRLYNNGVDPGPEVNGMLGRDFNNGFCMGGPAQLYKKMD
ncbi:MAG: hypothetical protein U0V54_08245 [Saprospiraceae bacterium]|nr:hypothetical protein [Saprospiraceae bacterium]